MCKSKGFRLLCLLCVFSFCLASFGLNVSAADSTNLVDSNLLNWNTTDPNHVSVNLAAKDVYRVYYKRIPLTSEPDAPGVRAGAVYSLTNLTAGNSYTFNIDLMGVQQIKDSGALQGGTLTAAYYYAPLTDYNGELLIGLASYDSTTGSFDTVADGSFVKINGSNYKEYFSKTLTISFTLPNVVNPCIVISYMDLESAGNNCSWYFRNISLVDNAQAEEDGFFARLFEWFQERFDSVGNWFTNLGNSIGNWFVDLGNSIGSWFADLKENLVSKLESLKQSFVDLGNSLVEGIKSLFIPDEQYISDWKDSLNQLLADHLGIIYTSATLIGDMAEMVFDIVFEAPDTYSLTIPEIDFTISGTHVHLLDETNVDFSFMNQPFIKTLYSMYTVALYLLFGGIEIKYAYRVYQRMMSN